MLVSRHSLTSLRVLIPVLLALRICVSEQVDKQEPKEKGGENEQKLVINTK